MNPKKTFIVKPPLKILGENYLVMIDGKYYRVLSNSSWTTDEKGKIISWSFNAQLITSESALKLLREGKMACLLLESGAIKKVYG